MKHPLFRGKRVLIWFALLAFVPVGILLSNKEAVATGSTPGLTPRRYDVPLSMAMTFAGQFANRKLGWEIVKTDNEEGTVKLKTSRFLGLQKDDLLVQCKPTDDPRYVEVFISSRGNFNGKDHILALQAGMDDKLPSPQ